MHLLTLSLSLAIYFAKCEETITDEDRQVLNDTIAKYGLPFDYKNFNLPGPELKTDSDIHEHENQLISHKSSLLFRYRTITKYFSYNARYEHVQLKKTGEEEMAIVKGQFGEHFKRESGGFYVRTIGYTLDENGYFEFLIDLTVANITKEVVFAFLTIDGSTHKISTTVLITLTGGGYVG